MERQNYLLQTRSQFVLSTMSSWGGGGGGVFLAKTPKPQKEVVQHADLGSKCAFVHFVTGPVSVIDARLECYLTNNRKTSLNRNNETIKSANIVVLQNSTE